jgi:hypothetical protein
MIIVVVEIVTVEAPPASAWSACRACAATEASSSRQAPSRRLRAADVHAIFTGNGPDIPSLEEQSTVSRPIGPLLLRHRRVGTCCPAMCCCSATLRIREPDFEPLSRQTRQLQEPTYRSHSILLRYSSEPGHE